jgi:hypothetical protein
MTSAKRKSDDVEADKSKGALCEAQELEECFVIMPISDQEGYPKGHFTRVYEDIIKPACKLARVRPKRADDVKKTNLIHTDILKSLLDAPIAICDLSSKNPNVMFELGIRQAFDKPVVLIKDEKTSEVFDISILRYETYNSERRYDEVVAAQRNISRYISETMSSAGSGCNSIIKMISLDVARMSDISGSDADFFGIIMEQLSALTRKVDAASNQDKFKMKSGGLLGGLMSGFDGASNSDFMVDEVGRRLSEIEGFCDQELWSDAKCGYEEFIEVYRINSIYYPESVRYRIELLRSRIENRSPF